MDEQQYTQKKIQEIKSILQKFDFRNLIRNNIDEGFRKISQTESVYACGIEFYTWDYRGLNFAFNTEEGLKEIVSYYMMKYPEDNEEARMLSIKWNPGDWKHFPYKDLLSFKKFEELNLEIWHFRESLQDFEETIKGKYEEDELDEMANLDENQMRIKYNYFDLTDDLMKPIADILQFEINEALKELKFSDDIYKNVMVGAFGSDIDADLNLYNWGKVNDLTLVENAVNDYRRLVEIVNSYD